MITDEPLPIGTVTPEQIAEAKERAKALDLAEIERRYNNDREYLACDPPGIVIPTDEGHGFRAAHADRGALLAALREARAEVERLRPIVEGMAKMESSRHGHGEGPLCPDPGCGYPLGHPEHEGNARCLWLRARAALCPAGALASINAEAQRIQREMATHTPVSHTDLASIPPDECDGADR